MYRRLDLAPKSPFHDIEGFVGRVRAAHTGITDAGVNHVVKRSLDGYNPRHSGRVVHLYGADIMTADLSSIPAWDLITPEEQRRIAEHPMDTGERIDPENVKVSQLELARRLDRRNVNRSVLISPRGLSRSYVWRLSSAWVQEVTDDDYALILSVQGNTRIFRDPDIHGPYTDARSYDAPPTATYITKDQGDVDALMRELTRRPQWSGANTGTD